MTVHTIMLPDMMRGREPRSVIWDDEAGIVAGEHWDVPWMQSVLARPTPVEMSSIVGPAILHDPGHDPGDFLFLLVLAFSPVMDEPLRSSLPSVFDGVETPHFETRPGLLDADGNLLPGISQ